MYAVIGRDTAGRGTSDVGQNIFLSYDMRNADFGNYVGQGIKYHVIQGEFKFTYFLIRGLNMRLEAGFIERYITAANGYQMATPYTYVGIKTSMYNFYRDN
jgi:hypothetical protein